MDKRIEDFLHLYLGCECEFKTVETKKVFYRKLIGIDVDYLFQPAYDRNPVYEYIKPILRPLSGMTEEDHKKCKDFRWHYIHSRKIAYEDQYSQLVPEEFIYLLKQGFDLFGLIESGLAINKLNVTPIDKGE